MTTFAVTRTKNEADIIESSITRMLTQVDHVIIGDGSTDGTKEILEQLPVTLLDDQTPTYEQPAQMTAMAHRAREMGADWVVPFDGDEIWLAAEGRITDRLAELPAEILIAEATVLDHKATALDDAGEADPVARMGWRCKGQLPLRKVAVRALEGLSIHFGNHGASFEGIQHAPAVTSLLNIRHFPYRTAEQFINKIAVGAPQLLESDLPEEIGKHWRDYGRTLRDRGPDALREHFAIWNFSADPENDPELVFDPAPDLRTAALCP